MQEQEIRNALRSIKRLGRAHALLQQNILKSYEDESEYGQVLLEGDKINIRCLGCDIWIRHRPVVRQGGALSFEYEFLTKLWDDDHVFMRIYMNDLGVLFRDASHNDYFGNADSGHLQEVMLSEVIVRILQSAVFAPS